MLHEVLLPTSLSEGLFAAVAAVLVGQPCSPPPVVQAALGKFVGASLWLVVTSISLI